MPKLGIVVPHYNQHETLYMSVGSLLTSKVEKKIVVVDDGSVPSVVYAPPIPDDVSVIGINPNHGVQVARNTGFQYLSRFKCEYILFSDSDVIWMPRALDKMIAALDADKGASFAYCDFIWGHINMFAGYWDKEKLYKENYISTMSVIRTSCLMSFAYKPWNEGLKRLQDWALWLSLVNLGCRGVYVQDVLFKTPLRDDGISRTGSHAAAVKAVKSRHPNKVSSCLEDLDMGSAQKITTPPIGGDAEAVMGEFSTGLGKYFVHGTTVPTDGVAGYAPGCLFIKVGGGDGDTLYLNEGTLASADFNLVVIT